MKIQVYNTHYQLVAVVDGYTSTGEGFITWDVSGIVPGVYFYEVISGNKKLSYEKLVIAR